MKPNRRILLGAVVALVTLGSVATGCSSNGASDSKAATSDVGSGTGGSSAGVPEPAPADAADKSTSALFESSPVRRSVIATGSLSLRARHPDDVRRRAVALVDGLGGSVDKEQATSDRHGTVTEVFLTLRVPAASFDKALDQLAGLGTLVHREQDARDVTTQVIDLDAKVKAQRAAVDSFEQLLARARTIGEILSIENQLSTRQGELDSLVQQQKYLADQTAMSTIEVDVTRPHAGATHETGGFVGGLQDGWHALGSTAVALGAVLGAVLPFAMVLALIAVPVWVSARRIRARGRSAA